MLEQLFYIVRNLERELRVACAPFKLSPFLFRTVVMILKSPEITADTLSKKLVADKALVARTVTELTEKSLIGKKANPNDKRSSLLIPSDKLLAMKDSLFEIERDVEDKIREVAAKEGIRL